MTPIRETVYAYIQLPPLRKIQIQQEYGVYFPDCNPLICDKKLLEHIKKENKLDELREKLGLPVVQEPKPEEQLKEKQERIICAAMKLQSGKVYYGHRHPHCVEAANGELSWELSRKQITEIQKIQGFVTSNGRFVNRVEAAKIWLAQDINNKLSYSTEELYSEDLY